MNRITFPLRRRTQGPPVADLQDALLLLLARGLIFAGDEAARREFAEVLRPERAEQAYGTATAKLVGRFQEEHRLAVIGDVDEATANALNAVLKELGVLDQPSAPSSRIVSGVVRREDGLTAAGLRVRAVHETGRGSIRLGEDTTDAEGSYTIRYDPLPGFDTVQLRVIVLDQDARPIGSSEVMPDAKPLETVDVSLPLMPRPADAQRIEGTIVLEHGAPAENLQLRLYRREFGGGATRLAEATTRPGGRYAFALAPDGRPAGLEVRAVQPDGTEIPLSRPLTLRGSDARVSLNLVAPGSIQAFDAEYQRLTTDLTAHLGDLGALTTAKETGEQQDITILYRDTGWDARLIALAATGQRLAADPDVSLPREALYGLLRAGLPSDKQLLAQVESEVAERALKKTRDAGIIGISDQEIDQFKQAFDAFSTRTRLAMPAPGSRSSYGQLLQASGLAPDAQARFAPVYLHHRGTGAQLWDEAKRAGMDDAQIGRLQLQGKLAFLAGNSEGMTTRLLNKGLRDPVELTAQDYHRAEAWRNDVFEQAGIPPERRSSLSDADRQLLEGVIPGSYAGGTVESRLETYAEDLARKVRLSYPTQVLGRLMETDATFRLPESHESTVSLVKNAAAEGFRFGETPVTSFLKSHPGARGNLSDAEFRAASQQLGTMQRVYQITPDDDAVPVLLSLGMTSAFDVMAYSETDFVMLFELKYLELHGRPASPGLARLVIRKAKQVSSVTYNLFTIAKKLESEPPVAGLSAPLPVRNEVRNELIKHFPTMESLFGSMDFCDCEHCRSVLSPAAYLVDLLQFVDIEPGVWGNFLAHWKATHGDQDYPHQDAGGNPLKPFDVLVQRRPDLQHIALTCENTNTAMPYIDIVNEILEYFVAHGKLEKAAAHDTEGATTAELLAEPQNVIREAYDTLRAARYPTQLPFDLWIETVRRFCNHFDMPLHRLLEAVRPGDDLFAPSQPFDRAAAFVEALEIAPAEAAIFTAPDLLDTWHQLYGFSSAQEATTEATDAAGQRIDLNSAKALSRRLGLTYRELTDIVQTEFVNPELGKLGLLYKLGFGIADARFYVAHRALLQQDPATLSPEDQKRRLEAEAFAGEITALATSFGVTAGQLETAIQAIPFDRVLVLADPDAGCDFDLTTLRYSDGSKVDAIALLRINLLVRLWRKLGWSIEETDRALRTLLPSSAPFEAAHLAKQPLKTALVYLGHLKELDLRLKPGKQGRLKLLTLWSDLPTTGRKPLYAQLFLTRSVLQADTVFDDPLGLYLSAFAVNQPDVEAGDALDPAAFGAHPDLSVAYDPETKTQRLRFKGFLTDAEKAQIAGLLPGSAMLASLLDRVQAVSRISSHLLALQGALGLTADEIGRTLSDAGLALDRADLSLANVSLLYRYGLLARALKLSVRELIALKQLSGLDPFAPLHPDPLETLEDDHPFTGTLEFVRLADEVKGSGISIEDLDYLLRHRFDEAGKYRPDREATLALLKTVAEAVRAIRAEHAVPDDPGAVTEEVLRQKLGLVLPADVVATFMAMLNGSVEFTGVKGGVAPGDLVPADDVVGEPAIREVVYNAARQEQRLTYRGVLLDAEKAALKARHPSPVMADLLDDVQQQGRSFFDRHLGKGAAGVQPASGFLDAADYDLLFTPPPGALTEAQRARVAQAFLPFLQQRLIRQLIVQVMIAQTGGDPVLVESLLADGRLLAAAGPLLDAFASTAARGVAATFRASADGSGPASPTITLADGDIGAKDRNGNPVKPAGTNSARLEGYLEAPTAGAYRFSIELDKQNAEGELRFPHLPEPLFLKGTAGADHAVLGNQPNEVLELKAGVLYRFSLELKHLGGGGARLLVQGESFPKGRLSQLVLTPAGAIDQAERAMTLLSKALQVVQGLGLSEREVRYLLTHAPDFGGVSLSELPTEIVGDSPAESAAVRERFGRFRRLAAYARLKRDMAGGTDDLIGIFEANGTPAADRLEARVYPLIAAVSRRDPATVKAASEALAGAATPAFASEAPLARLWEMLQVVERFGVPASSLLQWTAIVNGATPADRRFAIARDLKEAIKARFEPEVWQRVAQPIFDQLRRRQRDALVAQVIHQHGFDRLEQLYEYFLIDPGMEPVVQTSRIRLAIGSLQLFVQRCLLNLEPHVHPSVLNARQWEWMKRYRVWEANRKIFLFPENWLEPEFRDDKTHLFAELEGALLQGDVSSDLVEDAFLNYLRKLDELARLDIVAMHLEDDPDPARRTLHVFGRTFGQPHKYFYRRYAHQMWTPWEPVGAEIDGNHLAPVVWRDRLYLFWVTFMEKAVESTTPITVDFKTEIAIPSTVQKKVEAQLHWSEYLNGEWTTRESAGFDAPSPVYVSGLIAFEPNAVFIHVSKEYDPTDGAELGVFVHLGGAMKRSFYLAGRNSRPERGDYGAKPENPFDSAATETATRYAGSGALEVSVRERITTEPGKTPPPSHLGVLEQSGRPNARYTLLPCDNDLLALGVSEDAYREAGNPAAVKAAVESGLGEIAALMKPVFYQDNRHTFFIEPEVTERTIEEWQEWVTRTPEPEPDWRRPEWWDDLVVVPAIPWRFPIPEPGDPLRFPIDPGSRVKLSAGRDWLVNPATALRFDDVLIGPTGQSGLEIVTGVASAAGQVRVDVEPAGVLAAGSAEALRGESTVVGSGLQPIGGGINIVGRAGFNSALVNNLHDLNGSGFGGFASVVGTLGRRTI